MYHPGVRLFAVGCRSALVVLSVGLLAGCFVNIPQFPPSGPKAALTLQCPEPQIAIRDNSAYSQIATGCGRTDVMIFAANTGWSSLRERATFELSCPNEQIIVTLLSPQTYGVTGCAKKAVYTFVSPNIGLVTQTIQQTN